MFLPQVDGLDVVLEQRLPGVVEAAQDLHQPQLVHERPHVVVEAYLAALDELEEADTGRELGRGREPGERVGRPGRRGLVEAGAAGGARVEDP